MPRTSLLPASPRRSQPSLGRLRPRVVSLLVATSLVAGSLPSIALAQMDPDTKEAKQLFEDGVKLYKGGSYEDARVKFKAAYGLKKRVSIVLNLARAELMTKRPQEAANHFREVLAMSEAKDDDKTDAQQGLADARKQLGVVMIDAPSGSTVTVDGAAVASVPADGIELAPGAHTVSIKSSAGESVEKVTLEAGGTKTVKAKAATSTPDTTTTTTTTPTTTTPPDTTTTTPPDTTTTTTTATTTTASTEGSGTHPGFFASIHPITYATAGATILFGALWIGFYGATRTHSDNADKLRSAIDQRTARDRQQGIDPSKDSTIRGWNAQGNDEVNQFNSDKTLALTFGLLTGVAAGATVVTFVLLRKKDREPSVAFGAAPLRGGGASFSLSGSF